MSAAAPAARGRYEELDALRGCAICVMLAHHAIYDLVMFCGLRREFFVNSFVEGLHSFGAIAFVLLAGISSHLTRAPYRRAAKTLLVALAITLVTSYLAMPIRFGILHMMGVSMLLYAPLRALWQRVPSRVAAGLCLAGIVGTMWLDRGVTTQLPHLWALGFVTPDFVSTDYFPLLPWFFVFLLGAVGGRSCGMLCEKLSFLRLPRLARLGKHSLLIYCVHQPLFYGLAMLYRYTFMM